MLKFSIITLTSNSSRYLSDAIRSLEMQSYKHYQYIVIDNLSTDSTMDILNKNHALISLIVSEKDNGIYDALNKGISMSDGDVIGLIHSDDIYADPQVLSDVAEKFADPNVEAVYGDLDYVSKFDVNNVKRHWVSSSFYFNKLRKGWMPPHPTLFIRSNVFQRLGSYDTHYRISADYELILRFFGKGQIKSIYIPRVLVKMRIGGESNKSLKKILKKSLEDYRALRKNQVGGLATLLLKNITKLNQFF